MIAQQEIFFPEDKKTFFQYHLGNLSYVNKQASVACFHIPYPIPHTFESEFNLAIEQYEQIVVAVTEMHPSTINFVRRYDDKKIAYFFCGKLNQKLIHSQEHEFLDWFIQTLFFYKEQRPNVLNKLRPYDKKPLYFDALLGRHKPHRSLIWNYINQNLPKLGVATYVANTYCDFNREDSKKWIWEHDGLVVDQLPKFTIDKVIYNGCSISLSHIVPISVYNQTAYSVVAETNLDDDYVFFTEKTVKPLLARRLFLISGNRYSLKTLKELGFKTFDTIIDETYDTVADYQQRTTMMLHQLKWLCEQDQETILAQAKPIVDHNYIHLTTTDWYERFSVEFAKYFK